MPSLQSVDFSRESWPYAFYSKPGVRYNAVDISFPLSYGMHYLVQRLNMAWSSTNINVPGVFANQPQITFYKDSGSTALQITPFDMALITSPAESAVVVDFTTASRPFTAMRLARSSKLDVLYVFRDNVSMTISNITVADPANPDNSLPSYIEIMVIGRYYPALDQEGWGR
jgi:hypothetical protein